MKRLEAMFLEGLYTPLESNTVNLPEDSSSLPPPVQFRARKLTGDVEIALFLKHIICIYTCTICSSFFPDRVVRVSCTFLELACWNVHVYIVLDNPFQNDETAIYCIIYMYLLIVMSEV